MFPVLAYLFAQKYNDLVVELHRLVIISDRPGNSLLDSPGGVGGADLPEIGIGGPLSGDSAKF